MGIALDDHLLDTGEEGTCLLLGVEGACHEPDGASFVDEDHVMAMIGNVIGWGVTLYGLPMLLGVGVSHATAQVDTIHQPDGPGLLRNRLQSLLLLGMVFKTSLVAVTKTSYST